ncbi:MAG TPA: endonuclease/exonuclease/phosphatase family protein, partial [Sphingobacterium sp.]|nr:endonuclease/exonuclease/phosphatase family protein [Sphingobacterium sp.]
MMKNYVTNSLLYIVIFCLAFTACGSNNKTEDPKPDPPGETGVAFKVMTYNLWASRPGNLKEQNMKDMAEVIKRADPDLVALQEVDKFTRRNPMDVTKELSERTGMQYYFYAKAMDHNGGEYGDAILSKLPLKGTKAYVMGTTTELPGEPRSVAQVTVEKEGKEIYFISTHLDHLAAETNRIKQAKDLVDILKTLDKPVILGGDLNAQPQSETITILRTHLTWGCLNNNCPYTFPWNNPN